MFIPGDIYAFYLFDLAITSTTNIATWTAYDDTTPISQTATATATVIVSGSLPVAPDLEIYPTILQSSQPSNTQVDQTITLYNWGTGFLTWQQTDCATPTASWFSLLPMSGTVAPHDYAIVTAQFDSTGLISGTYNTDLCLSTNDPEWPTVTLPVSLNIIEGGFQLEVTLSESYHECGLSDVLTVAPGTYVTYCYTIYNGLPTEFFMNELDSRTYGTYQVHYPIPAGGTTHFLFQVPVFMTTTDVVTWTATSIDGSITASDVGSSTVYVDGQPQPIIQVFPPALRISQLPDQQRQRLLYIANAGIADLIWSVDDCSGTLPSWLSLWPASGTIPPWVYGENVEVTFDSTGLLTGTYNTDLCVVSNDPAQMTTTVPVTLNVRSTVNAGLIFTKTVGLNPAICSPTQVITVPAGTDVTFCYQVRNDGNDAFVAHDIEDPTLGIFLEDFFFHIFPGEAVNFVLTLAVDQSFVSTATWTAYTDYGAVDQAQSAATVIVSGNLPPQAAIFPPQLSTYLAPESTTQRQLTLQNSGYAELVWSLADCSGTLPSWLTLNGVVSGTLIAQETAALATTFDSTGLLTGTYNTDLCFNSNDPVNSVITIPVALNVQEGIVGSLIFTKTVGTDNQSCALTSSIDVAPGTEVTYCYQIENAGNDPFLLHDVSDSALGDIVEQFPYPILPGERAAFILVDVIIRESTTSTTTWTVYTLYGQQFTSQGQTTVNVLPPSAAAIDLSLTVGLEADCATTTVLNTTISNEGLPVTYCYQVTNNSPYLLDLHDVHDSLHGAMIQETWHDLLPGETFMVTQTTIITDTTINQVTWRAYIADGAEAEADATATVRHAPYTVYVPVMLK